MQTEQQQAATQDRVLAIKARINAIAEEIDALATPELTAEETNALNAAYSLLDQADCRLGDAFL